VTHTRGDRYRTGQFSNNLGQGSSYRLVHSSYADSYRLEQDLGDEIKSDTYRLHYESTTQTTSLIHLDSEMVWAPQVHSSMTAFSEPVPPPPSPATVAVDIDMDILLFSAGNLTINREESPKCIMRLTRELIVRGLPLELANLYASDKVSMIPVHKILPSKKGSINHCHKAQCKKCGKLQPRDFGNKKVQRKRAHTCSPNAAEDFKALLESDGWHQAFRDLDTKGWKLGPGPHEEKYSAQYLGQELFDAAKLARREGNDLVATFTCPGPLSSPDSTERTHGASVIAKSRPTKSKSPPNKMKAKKRKAKRALAQQNESKMNPDGFAQARAHPVILTRTEKQTETGQTSATAANCIAPQQALPIFDINNLEKQINLLSLDRLGQQVSGGDLVKEEGMNM
jgi:hypothetical protein